MIQGNQYSSRELEKKQDVDDVKHHMEEIALRLLLSLGELHGYKFQKYLENKFKVLTSPSETYPLLWSLRKREIITSAIEKIGERKRVVYHPIPFVTRNYLESKRSVENRNRSKINKIGAEYLSFQLSELPQIEVKER